MSAHSISEITVSPPSTGTGEAVAARPHPRSALRRLADDLARDPAAIAADHSAYQQSPPTAPHAALTRLIITGAAGAIGQALVESLQGKNIEMILADRSPARLETMFARFRTVRMQWIGADLHSAAGMQRLLDAAQPTHAAAPTIVHLAGHSIAPSVYEVHATRHHEGLASNRAGARRLFEACLAHLQRSGTGGHVVLLSSLRPIADRPETNAAVFNASLDYAADDIDDWMRTQVAAAARHRIRINVIAPRADSELVASGCDAAALDRLVQAIGRLILADARPVTGQVISVPACATFLRPTFC